MKVILQQDVKGIGKKGEVKDVAEGHARNYLLPRKLAVEASSGNMKMLKKQQQSVERKHEEALQKAKQLAEDLQKEDLVITAKAGKEGKLFGAVTNKQIAAALKKKKYDIDKRKIVLEEPIRSLGAQKVDVKLHPEVTAQLNVRVVEQS